MFSKMHLELKSQINELGRKVFGSDYNRSELEKISGEQLIYKLNNICKKFDNIRAIVCNVEPSTISVTDLEKLKLQLKQELETINQNMETAIDTAIYEIYLE